MSEIIYYCWDCEGTICPNEIMEGEQGEPICPTCWNEVSRFRDEYERENEPDCKIEA